MVMEMEYSKFLITLLLIFTIFFIGITLFIFYKTGLEPVVLVGAYFTFVTTELGFLASIKKNKINSSCISTTGETTVEEEVNNVIQ